MLELKPHQQRIVDTIPNKAGMWLKMRVGKTPTSIRLACERAGAGVTLIVCPKSLVTQWQREVDRWASDWVIKPFHFLSKEQFKKYWKELPKYDAIIIDEAHLGFANFKNQMFKAMMAYKKKHQPEYIWLLTGTPYTSSSWSIFSYGLLLDKQWNWYKWQKEFFYMIKMGHRMIPQARTDKDEQLQTIIRSLGPVIDLKDVIDDLPEDEDVIETFSLSAAQKKLIKDSFDPLPIVRFTRQHQIEQGVLKSDGYTETWSEECEKDKRLLEIVSQHEKIIIVCRYHGQIEKIHNILRHIGRPIFEIHGQTDLSAGDIALEAEQSSNAIVIAQGDTCFGYSLKSFNTMVFASMSYSYVNYDQMRSRMKAMEKTEPCTYIHLLTDGESVDKGVFDAVSKKQDFSIELFNKK